MSQLPELDENGDLPPGVHQATLVEVLERFGTGTLQRLAMARRLENIFKLASSTGAVSRVIVFGSFVTAKPDPNDIDVFMLMENTFDVSELAGQVALIFDHRTAQDYEGASVFWIRRLAALDGEKAVVEHWQIKRDGTNRGIVEVTSYD